MSARRPGLGFATKPFAPQRGRGGQASFQAKLKRYKEKNAGLGVGAAYSSYAISPLMTILVGADPLMQTLGPELGLLEKPFDPESTWNLGQEIGGALTGLGYDPAWNEAGAELAQEFAKPVLNAPRPAGAEKLPFRAKIGTGLSSFRSPVGRISYGSSY
jgi:hypothetical protein